METPLKILILEDSATDAEIIVRHLKKEKAKYEYLVTMNRKEFETGLTDFHPDVILSDNSLPQFCAADALKIIEERSIQVPFILVTGTVSEEYAASIIKLGADDYILKDRLTRLSASIDIALRQRQAEKEKEEAAQRLKRNEENYRSMMERVSDGFVALDKDWFYTYVNKKAGEIINRDPEELIGKNIWKEFPDAAAQPFFDAFSRAMVEQEYTRIEEYYSPLDLWTEIDIYPSPEGLSIFFRDITKRKKTEKAIKESEEKYRLLVEQAFDGIVIYSPDGRISDCNYSACHNTGYSYDEMLKMTITDLLFKDDIKERPLNFEGLKDGSPVFDYRKLKRKDGSFIEMELVTKMLPNGNLMVVGRDITERKKAKVQEALFTSIINSSDDAIISKTVDGVITSWNRGAQAIFGYSPDETIGKNISMLIPPDLAHEEHAIITRIRNGDFVEHFETERIKKDGSRISISLTISPVRNSKGDIIGASKIASDISARKEAERKIIQSEENLKTIFENTSEGLILVDPDGTIKAFNSRANKSVLLNSDKELKAGNNVLDYIENSRVTDFKKLLSNVMAGEVISYDRSFVQKDGELTWLNFSFNPVRKNDSINGICITSRDITEQKKATEEIRKSNERFEMAAGATNDVIWDWDLLTNKLWWNKNFYDHFGYKEKDTVPDISSWQVGVHPDDKERVSSGIRTAINDKKDFWSDEYRFLKANKDVAFILDCGYILYNDKGNPHRMVGAMLDITDRKKAEEQLKNSFGEKQALAKRVSAILNTLPANIALLDEKGIIADINDAWRNFSDENGFVGPDYGIGDDYIAISKRSFCVRKEEGKKVANGIRAVLQNKAEEFVFEYSCDSRDIKRWYRMVVTPLQDKEYTGAVVMHIDISELRRLEEERFRNTMEEQKRITRAMLEGQEKERNQIGRDLHDNISQLLAAIKMKLGFYLKKPDHENGSKLLAQCMEHTHEALVETRNLSHQMVMPRFAENSFKEALEQLIANYTDTKRSIELNTEKLNEDDVPALVKETLYRIVQEQLNNIEKYAKASEVTVQVCSSPDNVTMTITDNGVGFDMKKKRAGIGLTNILNRAESYNGSAIIFSEPAKGCKLSVEIPLNEE